MRPVSWRPIILLVGIGLLVGAALTVRAPHLPPLAVPAEPALMTVEEIEAEADRQVAQDPELRVLRQAIEAAGPPPAPH